MSTTESFGLAAGGSPAAPADAPSASRQSGDSLGPVAQSRCRLCDAALVGAYCHACGQASVGAARSFREACTGQTGRMLHTLRLLLMRPGELAREIDEGRDRCSMRPLTLLLNLIPLFFLLGGGHGGFGTQMFVAADTTGRVERAIEQRAGRRDVPLPVMRERVEQRFRAAYSLLVVVQAVTYGLAIALVERRHHKPSIVHLAAGIHYMCFSFLVSAVMFGAFKLLDDSLSSHPAAAVSILLVNATYMALALRRIYGDPPLRAAALAVTVMAMNYLVALTLTGSALLVALFTA